MKAMIKSLIKKSFHFLGYDIHALPAPVVPPPPLRLRKSRLPISSTARPASPILKPEATDGNATMSEIVSINSLVAKRAPKVFEIGTFDGRTSVNMIANAPKDAILYTLDLPETDVGKTVLPRTRGNSITRTRKSQAPVLPARVGKNKLSSFGETPVLSILRLIRAKPTLFSLTPATPMTTSKTIQWWL